MQMRHCKTPALFHRRHMCFPSTHGHLIASLRLHTCAHPFVPRTGMRLHGWRAGWAVAEGALAPVLGRVEEKHEAREGSRRIPERGSEESGTQMRQEGSARAAQGEEHTLDGGAKEGLSSITFALNTCKRNIGGGFIPLRPIAAAAAVACCCCCCAGHKHVGWG